MGLRRAFKKAFKKIEGAQQSKKIGEALHKCYVCDAEVPRFLPYRQAVTDLRPYMDVLGVVGSDLENFSCPVCYCTDRDRHLCMYFDALGLWGKIAGGRVLHFAPEVALVPLIQSKRPVEYVRADLFPTSVEIEKIDITAIPYPSDCFDVIICNHVLEHVPNDDLALREIKRALKPGGYAILQTPYSSVLNATLYDAGIVTEQQKLFLYGQEDHVRLYGNDFFEKIGATGLILRREAHNNRLAKFDARYYGVNQKEDLILAEKPS